MTAEENKDRNPIQTALTSLETFDFARVDFFDDIADLKITYGEKYWVFFYKFIILASDFEMLKSALLDKDVKEIESKFDDEELNLILNFMCRPSGGGTGLQIEF